jgi:hypothetical protein
MISDKQKQLLHILIKNKFQLIENPKYNYLYLIRNIMIIFKNYDLINHNFINHYNYILNIITMFCQFSKSILPEYYDSYKISIYIKNNKQLEINLFRDELMFSNLIKNIYIDKNYDDIEISITSTKLGVTSARWNLIPKDNIICNFYEIFNYNKIEEYLLNNDN